MSESNRDQKEWGGLGTLVQTFTLLMSASTATHVMRAIHDRRAGIDPSELEPPIQARSGLMAATRELQELLYPVFIAASAPHLPEESDSTVLIRQFDILHRLTEGALVFHRIHQHLMSLYPAVPDAFVEDARMLHLEARAIVQNASDAPAGSTLEFAERALAFSRRVQRPA